MEKENNYFKDFDGWNKIKKETDKKEVSNLYFKEQEIWWIRTGLNIGIESNGKGEFFTRPVLIIKKHNMHSCLVVSLTTNIKSDKSKSCLSKTEYPNIFAKLSQIKTIDSKRLSSKLFFLDQENFERIKEDIRKFNKL
jgi:mRNA interferase MazF